MSSTRQARSIVTPEAVPEKVRVMVTQRHKDQSGNRRRIDDIYLVALPQARELEALGYARILGPGPTAEKRAPGKALAPTGGAAPSPSSQPVPASPEPTATESTLALQAEDARALEMLQRAAATVGRSSPSKTRGR